MSRKFQRNGTEKICSPEEQQSMIKEIKRQTGPVADKFPALFSDASILRFLTARNWNTKKATKMLKDALKWHMDYKPLNIRWEDIAHEAETGKVYRADYFDKHGRSVVVMRPGYQNTTSSEGQLKYLVYVMEKTIMNMQPGQEQMVLLVDFQGYTMPKLSMKVTRDTARVLQNFYPERLGLALLYNPPKVFETFYAMVKPIIEPKTYKKVKFAYANDPQSRKIMESIFDMDKLESVFGGKNTVGFNYAAYAQRMKEEDKKMSDLNSEHPHPSDMAELMRSESLTAESESSDEGESHLNDETLLHLHLEESDGKKVHEKAGDEGESHLNDETLSHLEESDVKNVHEKTGDEGESHLNDETLSHLEESDEKNVHEKTGDRLPGVKVAATVEIDAGKEGHI